MSLKETFYSIVIPTYNHANFLHKALSSVISQTYQNWEAIIIDNYSNDNTMEIIESFNDPRLKTFQIDNKGIIASSRNLGISKSKGEWVAFLDSDDKWYPNKLSSVNEFLSENSECHIISNDENKIIKKKKIKKVLRYGPLPKNAYKYMLLYGNRLSTSATVVKKSFLERNNLKFNESEKFVTVEDFDFWLRLAKKNARFKFIPRVMGEYVIHSSNTSNQGDITYKNSLSLLKYHIDKVQEFSRNKEKLLDKVLWNFELNYLFINFNKKEFNNFIYKISYAFFEHPIYFLSYFSVKTMTWIINRFPFLR